MFTLLLTTAPAPMPAWVEDVPPFVWGILGLGMWLLFAWMVGRQARAKGQGFWRYFIASLFFSPFALSLALHLMRDPAPRPRPQQ